MKYQMKENKIFKLQSLGQLLNIGKKPIYDKLAKCCFNVGKKKTSLSLHHTCWFQIWKMQFFPIK